MAENSNIEWTDHTVNLWWGCVKIHTGCKNCYAEKLSNNFGDNVWGLNSDRRIIKSSNKDLKKFQRKAKLGNRKVKVFVGSMMDIFEIHNDPEINSKITTLRDKLFNDISNDKYPNLVFLFLTKRPELINKLIPEAWLIKPPNNVWFGTSVANQETTKYVNELSKVLNANLFLSLEPQIGVIDELDLSKIKWVIQGGESGDTKRPFDIKWAEIIREICLASGVPYFFKQIDKTREIPDYLYIKEYPTWS